MMDPYGREAERCVLEGATPEQVDGALEGFGMAMGILAVYDMAGIDVGYLTRKERAHLLPKDPTFYRPTALLTERGWLGQKTGRGYYRYDGADRKRTPDPEAIAMFRPRRRSAWACRSASPSAQEIVERCLYAMINEGARLLEEGIALRASDIDIVYTSGYGFPRYRGGPMFYADTVGLEGHPGQDPRVPEDPRPAILAAEPAAGEAGARRQDFRRMASRAGRAGPLNTEGARTWPTPSSPTASTGRRRSPSGRARSPT